MNRTRIEEDAYELDYTCSYRIENSPETPCRDLSGQEKRNRTARYSRRPARQSSAGKGIHRRGGRQLAA